MKTVFECAYTCYDLETVVDSLQAAIDVLKEYEEYDITHEKIWFDLLIQEEGKDLEKHREIDNEKDL